MKVVLDLDDFSVIRNCLPHLRTIKEHYPNFKVSLFTIPYDYEFERSDMRINRKMYLDEIHECLDWMEFIPHGLAHLPREFENATAEDMQSYIDNVEEQFKRDGLPMVKGFKAPYWLWNKDVVEVLNKNNWWGGIDPNQPNMLRTKRFYEYSHSIDTPFWNVKTDILKLHGHMTLPSSNNLEDCLINILKLPSDVEWCFASEFVEESK